MFSHCFWMGFRCFRKDFRSFNNRFAMVCIDSSMVSQRISPTYRNVFFAMVVNDFVMALLWVALFFWLCCNGLGLAMASIASLFRNGSRWFFNHFAMVPIACSEACAIVLIDLFTGFAVVLIDLPWLSLISSALPMALFAFWLSIAPPMALFTLSLVLQWSSLIYQWFSMAIMDIPMVLQWFSTLFDRQNGFHCFFKGIAMVRADFPIIGNCWLGRIFDCSGMICNDCSMVCNDSHCFFDGLAIVLTQLSHVLQLFRMSFNVFAIDFADFPMVLQWFSLIVRWSAMVFIVFHYVRRALHGFYKCESPHKHNVGPTARCAPVTSL